MTQIPTAENFYERVVGEPPEGYTEDIMIDFAKLHVKEALKSALENIPCIGSSTDIATYEEIEKAVLNAYPLINIK